MSFHLSAENIRIEENRFLRARLRDANGEWRDAEIDLDRYIGNENGVFVWDAEGFSASAENVHFAIEGGGEVPVMRAHLRSVDGEEISRDVNLSERIRNEDGQFVFV